MKAFFTVTIVEYNWKHYINKVETFNIFNTLNECVQALEKSEAQIGCYKVLHT